MCNIFLPPLQRHMLLQEFIEQCPPLQKQLSVQSFMLQWPNPHQIKHRFRTTKLFDVSEDNDSFHLFELTSTTRAEFSTALHITMSCKT